MHGAGNDFLLVDANDAASLTVDLPALVPRLCDRRLGIGADGVLLLVPAGEKEVRLVYWNADGSEAAFCANGTRCAARFAAVRWGWTELDVVTGHARVHAAISGPDVTLYLPAPTALQPWRELDTPEGRWRVRYLVLGVPHLVVPVEWEDFWARPLAPLAPALRAHPSLPAGGANVNFVRCLSGELAVRSWERGIEGETLSCASGDAAAALVALAEGWLPAPAAVRTASGRVLRVVPEGPPPACPFRLSGPAEWVAEIEVAEELLSSP